MVMRIARKELTEMSRDGRFRWSATIVFALLIASLAAGWRHHTDARQERDRAQQAMREMWLAQEAKNPHSAAHYGTWAFKPQTPLSYLDRGVNSFVGQAAYLEAHRQNEFRYRPAMDATAVARFGEWTAAAVLQLLLPLLIIVLTFTAFAGEREQGTLRQLASIGVSTRDLALGKGAGVAGALALLLVPAALLGSAALALASAGTADVLRLGLMVLGYLAYFAIFISISLVVSAHAPSARVALVALLGFWVLNTLVAPRAFSDIARRVHPTPSAFQFATAMGDDLRKGSDGHTPDARAEQLRQEMLAQYGVTTVDSLPVNFDAVRMQRSEEDANVVFDRHFGALYDSYQRQNSVHQMGALVAPFLAIRSLSMSLAGTDVEQHRAFATEAERYRRVLVKEMNDDMARNSRTGDWEYKAGPEVWAQVPDFEYVPPNTASLLRVQTASIVLLALWLAASLFELLTMGRIRLT